MFSFIYFLQNSSIQLQTHELIVGMCLEIVINKGRCDTILSDQFEPDLQFDCLIMDINIVSSTETQLLRQINDPIPFIDGHIIRERNTLPCCRVLVSIWKFHFHIRILNINFSSWVLVT